MRTFNAVVERDPDSGLYIGRVPVALECEWTPGNETLWDFQKLLVSRARHRVLVMWARTARAAARAMKDLTQQVSRFRQTRGGDRYMLACYVDDTNKFVFRVHVA